MVLSTYFIQNFRRSLLGEFLRTISGILIMNSFQSDPTLLDALFLPDNLLFALSNFHEPNHHLWAKVLPSQYWIVSDWVCPLTYPISQRWILLPVFWKYTVTIACLSCKCWVFVVVVVVLFDKPGMKEKSWNLRG